MNQEEQDNPVPGRMPFKFRLLTTYRRFFNRVVHPFIPFTVSYDCGWMDGWNSCRGTPPEQREFMTRDKLRKRYNYVPSAEGVFNHPKDVQ
jgi:hypothetical protein